MCLAVPGQVIDLGGEDLIARRGRVRFGGVVKEVSFGLLPEAGVGDYVMVHAGVALSVVDQSEAEEVLSCIAQLDALEEDGREVRG